MDLGAGPWRDLLQGHPARHRPRRAGRGAARLRAVDRRLRDHVVRGGRRRHDAADPDLLDGAHAASRPEINAVSTLLLLATSLLLFAAYRLEQGRGALGPRRCRRASASRSSRRPSSWAGRAGARRARAEPLHLVELHRPRDAARSSRRATACGSTSTSTTRTRRCSPRCQAGNVAYDVLCPSNYPIEMLRQQDLLRPLDHSALPQPREPRPALPRPRLRPRQPLSRSPTSGAPAGSPTPKSEVGAVDSWAALWDARFAGRILMLDDPRETIGAALKWQGRSVNTTDAREPRRGAAQLLIEQKPLVQDLQLLQLRGRAAVGRRLARPGLERPVREGHGAGPRPRLRDPEGGRRACSSTAW